MDSSASSDDEESAAGFAEFRNLQDDCIVPIGGTDPTSSSLWPTATGERGTVRSICRCAKSGAIA